MYKKFSDAEKAGIAEQYWAGQSVAALCRQYDVCRSTLYSWLKPYRRLASSEKCQFAAFTQKDYTDLKRHAEKLENILQIPRQADCTPNAPLDDRLAAFDRLKGNTATEHFVRPSISPVPLTISGSLRATIPLSMKRIEKRSWIRSGSFTKTVNSGSARIRSLRSSDAAASAPQRSMSCPSCMKWASKAFHSVPRKITAHWGVSRTYYVVSSMRTHPIKSGVSDVTCFKVNDHSLYICVILDLFSRKIVSYRISLRNSTQLITTTFRNAYTKRGEPKGLVFHSDRGSQYTSATFRKLLVSLGVTQSFSQAGRAHDNAVAEAFFALLKKEEIYRRYYHSDRDFRNSIDRYMAFYNSERPHRYNHFLSPDEFETDHASKMSK